MVLTLQEAREVQRAKIAQRIFERCRQLRISAILKSGPCKHHVHSTIVYDAFVENTKNSQKIRNLFYMRYLPADIIRNVKEMLQIRVR